MKYESIKDLGDEKFRRLTGIQRSTFEKQIKRKKTEEVGKTSFH